LTEAPLLIIPNYSKDVLIFYFASFDTMTTLLLQKNDAWLEKPISFFSRALRGVEVKYDIVEKQAYSLEKALKNFRVCVLHSKVISYVPSAFCEGHYHSSRRRWDKKQVGYQNP
jgi:hypothetical protein